MQTTFFILDSQSIRTESVQLPRGEGFIVTSAENLMAVENHMSTGTCGSGGRSQRLSCSPPNCSGSRGSLRELQRPKNRMKNALSECVQTEDRFVWFSIDRSICRSDHSEFWRDLERSSTLLSHDVRCFEHVIRYFVCVLK